MNPYSVEHAPEPPALPGVVLVRPDVDAVVDAIATDLLFQAHACVREFGDFHLALSGGSTPEALYRRLMYDPQYRALPWARTHLWIVDERAVPEDHEKSNFRMIGGWIVDHSDIPRSQVHPMRPVRPDGSRDPHAARDYERELQEHLGWREKGHDRLDFTLLGMGADCHTASLFPRSPAQDEDRALVAWNNGPTVVPPERLTMTYRLINASRCVGVMVTGEGKRGAIARVVRAHRDRAEGVGEVPILGVAPVAGELRWYLDFAACPDGRG